MNLGSPEAGLPNSIAAQEARVQQEVAVFAGAPQDLRVSVHAVDDSACSQKLAASLPGPSASLLGGCSPVVCEKLYVPGDLELDCTIACKEVEQAKEEDVAVQQASRETAHIQELLLKLPMLDAWFNVVRKVGEGTFSTVYLATLKHVSSVDSLYRQQFAIKHLVPTSLPSRTEKELRCMQEIGGKDNVVSVDLCLRSGDCIVFVMPYLPHTKFANYMLDLDVCEVRSYMKNLMLALRRVHSFNVIHRDIKPSNFLYDRKRNKFLLVDFGLAQALNADGPQMSSEVAAPVPSTPRKRKRIDEELDKEEKAMPVHHAVKRLALQPRTSNNNVLDGKQSLLHSNSYKSPPAKPAIPLDTENTPPRKQKNSSTFKSPLKVRQSNDGRNSIKKKLFDGGCKVAEAPPSRQVFRSALSQSACNIREVSRFQALTLDRPRVGTSYVRVQNSEVKSHHQPCVAPAKPQQQFLFGKPASQPKEGTCGCYGRPMVCSICRHKKPVAAPRAGTPGFRPPEVLLKYHRQTTAVDMWAAGVILLCILSGCYPFFRAPDDLTALAEIITIFGSEKIKQVARKLGRRIQCSHEKKPLDLRKLCERLRRHCLGEAVPHQGPTCPDCKQSVQSDGCVCLGAGPSTAATPAAAAAFPDDAYHLVSRLLDCDPDTRITAVEALQHPFLLS